MCYCMPSDRHWGELARLATSRQWQPPCNWIFLDIRLFLVVLSLLWESGIALRIQTWIYLEITLKGKNNNTNYIQAYLRSKVTGSAAWSKCKFSCSGFPSILVPQLIAQNHSSIELDAASKGWIGWLLISIRPKSDHCLALVTLSLTNVVETWLM